MVNSIEEVNVTFYIRGLEYECYTPPLHNSTSTVYAPKTIKEILASHDQRGNFTERKGSLIVKNTLVRVIYETNELSELEIGAFSRLNLPVEDRRVRVEFPYSEFLEMGSPLEIKGTFRVPERQTVEA